MKRGKRPHRPQKRKKLHHILEKTTVAEIKGIKSITDAVLRFHWDFYSELAYQRKQIQAELCGALEYAAERDFSFSRWQRALKYRYSLHPLCSLGSRVDPGGRFNIGDTDPARFPVFSALYLAADRATAMQEMFGQGEVAEGLSALDLALTSTQGTTICSVSGTLESVVDVRDPSRLRAFVDLIKDFSLSPALLKQAKLLKQLCGLATTPAALQDVLLVPDWRVLPMSFDVPSSSQLFGQIALLGGFDGVLYPSKFTGTDCLAVFPQNLATSSGFIELDDDALVEGVPRRIDRSNWAQCEISADELRKAKPQATETA